MAVPCATRHCPGQASRRCLKPDSEQLSGNCCSCAGHGRRSQRGGPHAGIRTAERLEERNTFQREYRVLKEASGGLQSCCSDELQQMECNTSTIVRRLLGRAVQATLLQMQSLAVPVLPRESWQLLQMLPYHLYVRLLQRLGVDMGTSG